MAPTVERKTRSQTGNSKPRVIQQIENTIAPTKKRSTTKKSTTKANTSKPRSQTTATGRVTKKEPVVAKKRSIKKTPAKEVKDKVSGKLLKAEGKVERKPGKKAAGTQKEKPVTKKKVAAPKTKQA